MKQAFYDAFMDNPIVAAIKDEEGLEILYCGSAFLSCCHE